MKADALFPPRQIPAVDPAVAIALLRRWLARVIAADAFAWLSQEIEWQLGGTEERKLDIALGFTGRKLRRVALGLSPEDIAAAQSLRDGWQPQHWSTGETARVALLLATHRGDDRGFAMRLERLCVTAEITEHVSYMKGLAILPAGQNLIARAREGVRSSIPLLFEAIACHNPYPRDHFDTDAWNQMVVKCVFGGTPLDTLVGLYEHRNPDLLVMLRDLVTERHAAGRPLPKDVHDFLAE